MLLHQQVHSMLSASGSLLLCIMTRKQRMAVLRESNMANLLNSAVSFVPLPRFSLRSLQYWPRSNDVVCQFLTRRVWEFGNFGFGIGRFGVGSGFEV